MARHRTSEGSVLRSLLRVAAAGLATFAILVGILFSLDWRERLEKRLTATFGRAVTIGAVGFAREWPPRLAMEEIAVAGEGPEPVISAGEISLTLTPWQLARSGEFGRLTAYGVRVADDEADFAWAAPLVKVARLLPFVHVNLQDARVGADWLVIDHADMPVATDGLSRLTAELAISGEVFSAEGKVGMPAAVDKPVPLQLALRGPMAELEFDGAGRVGPLSFTGAVSVRVADAQLAADRLGVPVFALDGLRVVGMLEKHGSRYQMTRMDIDLDEVKLAGRATFLPQEKDRPAQLELKLAGGPIAIALPELDEAIASAPDLPFELRAEVTLQALKLGSVAFPRLDAVVSATGGEFAVERLVAEGLGGTVEAAGALRTEGEGQRIDLLFDLRQADAEAVLRLMGVADETVSGRLGAHVELSLAAADWKSAFDRAAGRVGLFLDRGALGRPILATFAGGHGDGEGLPAEAELSCALGDFAVNGGTAHAELLRLMAPEGDIAGEGWVHLPSREISFVLGNPSPAGPPFQLARNLTLRGSLLAPLAARAEAPAIILPPEDRLAAMTAALVPQIRATLGGDSPCLVPATEETPEQGGPDEAE